MILKEKGQLTSHLSPFDLVDNEDEVALAKVFAFLLSKDKKILADFLKLCGVQTVITEKVFSFSSIVTERKNVKGRTDIEIDLAGKKKIIIETKVKDNKAKEEQLDKYQSLNKNYYIVLISSKREYSRYKNVTWDEIITMLTKRHEEKELFKKFYDFYQKRYYRRNRNMQEILTQDLAIGSEVERYKKGCIYKGHTSSVYPLYFAPYFTRKSGEVEGISNLAKVLFVMKATAKELKQQIKDNVFCENLKKYAKDTLDSNRISELVNKWINGIKIASDKEEEISTYYFLDFPQSLPFPLRKGQGGAKGWISLMIPRHRMLSFDQLFYQMTKQKPQ